MNLSLLLLGKKVILLVDGFGGEENYYWYCGWLGCKCVCYENLV